MDQPRLSNSVHNSATFSRALQQNKAAVCALTASYVATFAGYPLDSLKSRLQIRQAPISVPSLALLVCREEGVGGFFRGLWIPLTTVSFIRATTFTIYDRTGRYFRTHDFLNRNSTVDVALTGGICGSIAGAVIAFGNAPLEFVKVRRQLEYSIAASKGIQLSKPPGTREAVREIIRVYGPTGFFIGFKLLLVRDVVGTGLYFLKYEALRHVLGRDRSGKQGPTPSWLPVHQSLVPFLCGSLAGVSSWGLIYPLDVLKTRLQQKALSGQTVPTVRETFRNVFWGLDPHTSRSVWTGIRHIYRGLGLSSVRTVINHGLLWTFYDMVANRIDRLEED